jgi:peptidoglycan/xylan/chitin deacetylase (PgdA/CDA1 family)
MYHGIQPGVSTRHPYYETNTSPQAFSLQMKYLRDNGYRALDLDAALRALELGENLQKQLAITFDDGYRDFYTTAYPILSEHGFSATVFLVTGQTGDPRLRFKGIDCLTWNEVRELHSNGIRIGSHTVSHPKLKLLSQTQLDYEIGRSKQAIEDKLGCSITSFCYPYAFPEADQVFTNVLENTLTSYGYQTGVCTVIGRASSRSNRFFLPRLPVNTWDDARLFQAKLEGAYDWLHFPQYVFKLLTRERQAA